MIRTISAERPRELRRRVLLPARLRNGTKWADACILNISTHGLMIQSSRPDPEGSFVELRRAELVIVARVVWQKGSRAGLHVHDRLPVEEIMSLGAASSLQLVACDGARVDRRRRDRKSQDAARFHGRLMEYIAVLLITIALAGGAWSLLRHTLAVPLSRVSAALDN
ncbi:MAG: PilZ domain-containing protein [Sphingomicrobium sp.]